MNRGLPYARAAFRRTLRDTVELLSGETAADDGLQQTASGGAWASHPAAVCLPGQARGVEARGGRLMHQDARLLSLAYGTAAAVGQAVRWQGRVYRVVELVGGHRDTDIELRALMEPEA